MADQKLMEGIRLFKKKDTQPNFVLASGVITPNALVAFLKANPEILTEYNGEKQVRIQVLVSQAGNPYVAVDTWKPNAEAATTSAPAVVSNASELPDTSDLPF